MTLVYRGGKSILYYNTITMSRLGCLKKKPECGFLSILLVEFRLALTAWLFQVNFGFNKAQVVDTQVVDTQIVVHTDTYTV